MSRELGGRTTARPPLLKHRAKDLTCPHCLHRRTKIEKEKKEHAKLHGMIRTEISGAEIAEEMEKERRFFQLQMCEVRRAGGAGGLGLPCP